MITRPKGRCIRLQQFDLLKVKLLIMFFNTLVFHVIGNGVFKALETYRTDEISF